MTNQVSGDTVLDLLTHRLAAVLGVPEGQVRPDSRFDEDLHADSLDLVEAIESLERALREEGVALSLPDEELTAAATVGEAAQRIAAYLRADG
jgi:acyl carrier protein